MNFNPVNISIFVLPSESVGAVLVEMSETIGSASIGIVDNILMATLPSMGDEIPNHVGTF